MTRKNLPRLEWLALYNGGPGFCHTVTVISVRVEKSFWKELQTMFNTSSKVVVSSSSGSAAALSYYRNKIGDYIALSSHLLF